jgi:hypothetical protein
MPLADSAKKALEQLSQAQAKAMSSYGGNPPKELTDQFQKLQNKLKGDMGWVQKLSDQMDEAEARLNSQLQAEAAAQREDQEDVDFEAYPWQLESEHCPAQEEMDELVQSLLKDSEQPQETTTPPVGLPKLPATPPPDIPEPAPYDPSEWESLDMPE